MMLPMIGLSQTWKYNSVSNDFEGKYKTASIKGNGSDYAYDNPSLVINSFENSGINFYISNAGQYIYGSNTRIILSFNNEKSRIYSAVDISWAGDNVFMGNIFTSSFNGIMQEEKLTRLQIFKKIMNASYLHISIRNRNEQNDMKFSLSRSTQAIKYVIPDFDKLIADKNTTQFKNDLNEEGEIWKKYVSQNENQVLKRIISDDKQYFLTVDNMPKFPGGESELKNYINSKMRYPKTAKKKKITGTVYVSYIVEKSGYVTNVKIEKGAEKSLDKEAIRIIKSLPRYDPGTQSGEKVRVLFTIPINFILKKPFEHTF